MHWSRDPVRTEEVVSRVQGAIADKTVLEIAKGMVAQYTGVSIAEAARMLRTYAQRHEVRLTDTAQGLVGRSLDLSAITGPADG